MIQFPQTFADLQEIPDLICFSNKNWNDDYRSRQIFSRIDNYCRVIYIQPAVYTSETQSGYLDLTVKNRNLYIAEPFLPAGIPISKAHQVIRMMLDSYFRELNIERYIFWYSNPLAIDFTRSFNPGITVYDCPQSPEKNAHFRACEDEVLERSDLIFTNGIANYEAYKDKHINIFNFPDSIDVEHFSQARKGILREDPKRIKIGYFGTIDRKINMKLVNDLADARPEWEFVLAGEINLSGKDLIQKPNVTLFNCVPYEELPGMISQWDAAFLPYSHTESTCFFYPLTPVEMIAAGKQVVSSGIRHMRQFGEMGLVELADSPEEFIMKLEKIVTRGKNKADWILQSHAFLASNSWDQNVKSIVNTLVTALNAKENASMTTPAFSVCLN